MFVFHDEIVLVEYLVNWHHQKKGLEAAGDEGLADARLQLTSALLASELHLHSPSSTSTPA